MGLIRTLLALAVVLGHAHSPVVLVGGRNAVQMFYAISGFLISYVWVERRSYQSVWAFYANRYLRLYPIYLVVAVLSLVGCLVWALRPELQSVYASAPLSAVLGLVLANVLIFGQDWFMFAAVQAHQLVFAVDFRQSEVPLWQGLLAPQAWTLGVELSFYAVAPFLLPRRNVLWAVLVASLALRVALVWGGVGLNDPWDYRFFPSELALFILGALAHQILRPWYARRLAPELHVRGGRVALWVLVGVIGLYQWLPGGNLLKSALLFAVFLPSLPLLFALQAKSPSDRLVGELSYPIYICHWLVIDVVGRTWGQAALGWTYVLTVLASSVLLAHMLNRWVGSPVERWRDAMRARAM